MIDRNDSLRILQVTTDDDRRGGQVFATDLAVGLERLGHDVRTVGLAPGDVGGLDLETLGPRRRHPRTIARLREAIRHVDVVVGHGSTTLPACAIASAGTGVPFVYRQISDSLFWANTPIRRLRVRWALKRATRIVALWDGAAATLVRHFGVPGARIDCVPNAVPAERFPAADDSLRLTERRRLGLSATDNVVAYVGALAEEKGVDIAIDAVQATPSSQLLVAGDGPARKALERRAHAAQSRVRFLGSLVDPRPVYAAADIVVLPSRGGDTMPAALIEAGMVGRAVISTAVAAIPSIVKDTVTGLLVAADDREAFCRAVSTLCDDSALRSAMAAAGRSHCVANFTIDVVARCWASALCRAMQLPCSACGCDQHRGGVGHPLVHAGGS